MAALDRRPQSLAYVIRHAPCVLAQLALRARDGAVTLSENLRYEHHYVRLAGAAVSPAGDGDHRLRLSRPAGPQRRGYRHGRDRVGVRGGARRADLAAGPLLGSPRADLDAVELRRHGRREREGVDPGGPAVGVHYPDRQRDLENDPPVL